jgi:hypothetical protein
VNDIKTLMADTDFQNRFGMHTKAFQELAANAILMSIKSSRDYTTASVRENDAGRSVAETDMGVDLTPDPKFSTPAVQAALIAGQAEEIKRLKDELAAASGKLASRETEMPILVTQRDEAARLSHQYRNERDSARTAFVRFQNIARNTARVLRRLVDGIPPDIDTIEDGCIRLHLKQVLDRHQSRLDGAKLLVEERDSLKVDLAREQEEHNRATTLHAETQRCYDVLRERFHSVMAELLPDHGPDADAYVDGHCDPVAHARRVATNQIPEGATCWNPEDSFHKLCIDACHEANRARGLFPKSDHLTLALAEEAGEVTKAVLDHRQGKCGLAGVRKEIVQTMAMCLRLAAEGDPTVDLKRSQE